MKKTRTGPIQGSVVTGIAEGFYRPRKTNISDYVRMIEFYNKAHHTSYTYGKVSSNYELEKAVIKFWDSEH